MSASLLQKDLDRRASQAPPASASARAGGRDRLVGLVGLALFAALCFMAAFPQWITPYDPGKRVGKPLEPPGGEFRLGTNDIGQDLLSELVWGTRASLTTGLASACLAILAGTIIGLISGYTNGPLSELLTRLDDLTLVLPFLPLVILLGAYLGPSQRSVILVLSLVFWAVPARLIRARVLELVNAPYIEAARALGAGDLHILWAHLWPGVRSLAMVQFTLIASASILAEASLSFLGLGDLSQKSWGGMLFFARASGAFLNQAWRWWVFPAGLMITLTVLSLVMMGYSLEKRFEPGIRQV